ncbi:MAG: hypothetical protein AB1728_05575 [Bacteroidota bacterium]
MKNHRTKLILIFSLLICSLPLSAQVVIKDTIAISPKKIEHPSLTTPVIGGGYLATYSITHTQYYDRNTAKIQITSPKDTTFIETTCTPSGGWGGTAYVQLGQVQGPAGVSINAYTCEEGQYVAMTVTQNEIDSLHIQVLFNGLPGGMITLTERVPMPSISITYPEKNQVLVLTESNQPVITVTESHSPNPEYLPEFEPNISITPAQIVTGNYYGQLQTSDTIEIHIIATATNERGTAADTTVLMLTKNNDFDHFQILVQKDTLSNREVATITVIAVNTNEEEVELDESTVIDFVSLSGAGDEYKYADLISAQNDTVDNLINIPYSVLRSGQIKIIARGDTGGSPPVLASAEMPKMKRVKKNSASAATTAAENGDFPKTTVIALKDGIPAKFGFKDVYLKPEINVIAVKDSIHPYYQPRVPIDSSRTKVKVAVTLSGLLYSGSFPPLGIELTRFAMEGTGGHTHTGDRPAGIFVENNNDTLELVTTGDTLEVTYQGSLFGGKEKIIGRLMFNMTPAIADTDSVVVRVPGLVELEAGTNYELVGNPNNHSGTNDPCRPAPPLSQHFGNHYGKPSLIQAIRNITEDYDSLNPGVRLRINDMSLISGGLFDFRNHWLEGDDEAHIEHRMGQNADIGYKAINPQTTCVDVELPVLLRLIGNYTEGRTVNHNDHYHIRIW